MLAFFDRKPRATINDHRKFQEAERLLPRLARGEYAEVEAHLDQAGDEARERLVEGLAASERAVSLSLAWTGARPGSALAHLVLGASYVSKGWDQYGAAPKLLKQAEDPLHEAARLDRLRPDPFAWLISAELGGANDRDKLASLFRVANGRAPGHWPTHYRFFQSTTAKRGGSHEDMFVFARSAAKRAARGSTIHALLAMAFCEFALAEGPQGRHRIRRPGCADELVTALYNWLDADMHSLDQRLMAVEGAFAGMVLNHFAVACYLCDARDEAQALVGTLQGELETAPWAWIANGKRESAEPAFVYDRVKRELERG